MQFSLSGEFYISVAIFFNSRISLFLKIAFFFFFNYLFIYFWLHWVFVAARGLSLVVVSGAYSLLQRTGFSLCLLLLQRVVSRCVGSVVVARGLYGTWALWRMGSVVVVHEL